MDFKILDNNVSTTMNAFLIIANILNLLYNVPQMVRTYRRKSAKDFSGWFLSLRIVGNFIWVAYAIEINSLLMLINNIVTVSSSFFIGYYKMKDYINKDKKIENDINDINDINDNKKSDSYYIEEIKEEEIKKKENIDNIHIDLYKYKYTIV